MRHFQFLRLLLLGALAIIVGRAQAALAHAVLDHATPPVEGTVHSAPSKIELSFTEAIESAFASIDVTDSTGQRLDDGTVTVDASDHRLAATGLKPLAAGTYTVTWRVVSVDSHVTTGHFTFSYAPG